MARLLREPLVVFAILGAALFGAYRLVRGGGRDDGGGGGGAAAGRRRRIDVDQALVDRLEESFRRAGQREPTRDELGEMVLDQVNEEILYREALALELDRDDPAVRRRLIEKMTVMKQPQVPIPEPSEAELRRWFLERRHHFGEPARFSFRQIFFDPQRRQNRLNEDAAKALALLQGAGAGRDARASAGASASASASASGDPSPLPPTVAGMPDLQVAHLFGKGFLGSLTAAEPGRWQGPFSSTQGLHVVWLERRQAARVPTFEEARPSVRADWITARSRGTLGAAAELRPHFEINVAPAVRQRLAGSALMAPLLGEAR